MARKSHQSDAALVSQRQFALSIGKSPQYFGRLVKKGIVKLIRGKVDPEAAKAAMEAVKTRGCLPSPSQSSSREVVTLVNGDDAKPLTYIEAKTESETYKAKLSKLEYEKQLGKLLDADRVLELTMTAFSTARVRLRGLGKSLAPLLAASNLPADCERILCDAIDAACESLSNEMFTEETGGN